MSPSRLAGVLAAAVLIAVVVAVGVGGLDAAPEPGVAAQGDPEAAAPLEGSAGPSRVRITRTASETMLQDRGPQVERAVDLSVAEEYALRASAVPLPTISECPPPEFEDDALDQDLAVARLTIELLFDDNGLNDAYLLGVDGASVNQDALDCYADALWDAAWPAPPEGGLVLQRKVVLGGHTRVDAETMDAFRELGLEGPIQMRTEDGTLIDLVEDTGSI